MRCHKISVPLLESLVSIRKTMFGRRDSLDDHHPLVRVGPDLGTFPGSLDPIGETHSAYRNFDVTFIDRAH
jgi:hypothetical protein